MGFFEILLIAVITLLVVGPERMPEAVRSVALTVGRIKRSFDGAREEIEKQIGADDIRRQLHNEAVMESLEKIKGDLSSVQKQASIDFEQGNNDSHSDNLSAADHTQADQADTNPNELSASADDSNSANPAIETESTDSVQPIANQSKPSS